MIVNNNINNFVLACSRHDEPMWFVTLNADCKHETQILCLSIYKIFPYSTALIVPTPKDDAGDGCFALAHDKQSTSSRARVFDSMLLLLLFFCLLLTHINLDWLFFRRVHDLDRWFFERLPQSLNWFEVVVVAVVVVVVVVVVVF